MSRFYSMCLAKFWKINLGTKTTRGSSYGKVRRKRVRSNVNRRWPTCGNEQDGCFLRLLQSHWLRKSNPICSDHDQFRTCLRKHPISLFIFLSTTSITTPMTSLKLYQGVLHPSCSSKPHSRWHVPFHNVLAEARVNPPRYEIPHPLSQSLPIACP